MRQKYSQYGKLMKHKNDYINNVVLSGNESYHDMIKQLHTPNLFHSWINNNSNEIINYNANIQYNSNNQKISGNNNLN